jgi:hypothetical protein
MKMRMRFHWCTGANKLKSSGGDNRMQLLEDGESVDARGRSLAELDERPPPEDPQSACEQDNALVVAAPVGAPSLRSVLLRKMHMRRCEHRGSNASAAVASSPSVPDCRVGRCISIIPDSVPPGWRRVAASSLVPSPPLVSRSRSRGCCLKPVLLVMRSSNSVCRYIEQLRTL